MAMTKEAFKHVLPPVTPGGKAPFEYGLLARSAKIAARLAREGEPDDLFSAAQVARDIGCDPSWMLRQWTTTGRGPQSSRLGKRQVFRRDDVVAWLQFLAQKHKALMAA